MFPVLFKWGPITLYSYGFMVAVGFVVASMLAARRAAALGIDPVRIQRLTLRLLVAGLIGARAAYVLLNVKFFRSDPLEILRIDHGGLVFYGGLAAGVAVGVWTLWKDRVLSWQGVDLMMPPLALAHAFGRVGCFLNGCCYGEPSSAPWAVAFPTEGIPRHPTQLYEMAALLVLFFLLKNLEHRSVRPGTVTLVYGLFYGTWRFGIEFLRGDNPAVAGGLTVFQMMSIPLIAVSVFILLRRIKSIEEPAKELR